MAVDTTHVGDAREFTILFQKGGAAADPVVVRLHLRRPGGTYVSLTYNTDQAVEKLGIGSYKGTFVLDTDGWWIYAWEGIGNVDLYEEGTLYVLPARAKAP